MYNNNFFKRLSEEFEETLKFLQISTAIEESLKTNDDTLTQVQNLLKDNLIIANSYYGESKSSVFMIASAYNSPRLFDLFSSHIKSKKELDMLLRAPDSEGIVPLACAFLKGNDETYNWLIQAGVQLCDPAATFDRLSLDGTKISTVAGLTALHILAARMPEQDISKLESLFPNNSANINVIKIETSEESQIETKETPLDMAYRRPSHDRENIIKFLKNSGAKTYHELLKESLSEEDTIQNHKLSYQ